MSIAPKPDRTVSRINLFDFSGYYSLSTRRTSQSRPYNKPTSYKMAAIKTSNVVLIDRPGGPGQEIRPDSGHTVGFDIPERMLGIYSDLLNRVRGQLVSQLGETSSMWAVNIAERQQSVNALANRTMQIVRFTRHLKRFDIYSAARELNLSGRDRRVIALHEKYRGKDRHGVIRDVGNAFLEFHFGWEPLVKDIYATCDLLQQALPTSRLRGAASTDVSKYTYIDTTCENGTPGFWFEDYKGKLRVHAGCYASINNPNAYLANRTGLVNPATVLWELIPFSFVVDWFGNVGQVLSQYTDFVGVNVVDPFHGYKLSASAYTSWLGHWFCNKAEPETGAHWVKEGVLFERFLGLPEVTLRFAPPPRLSLMRGLTAISLLLQKLPRI